ncbi:MAG: hypothetical protein ABEN55_20975, partial [Bradymonadaceae bacterium]
TNIGKDKCASSPEQDGVQFAVTPAPSLASVAPTPLCSKQKTYESLKLEGAYFIKLETDHATLRPSITIGGKSFQVHRLDACAEFQRQSNETAWRCSTAFVRIQAGQLDRLVTQSSDSQSSHPDAGADAGSDVESADTGGSDAGPTDPSGPTPTYQLETLDVTLTNPEPTRCQSANTSLSVVPPPVVHDATPDPLCNVDQENGGGTKTVTVDGSGFLVVDGQQPTVELGGSSYQPTRVENCTALDVPGRDSTVERCSRLAFELPAGTLTDKGAVRNLTVQNPGPASCTSEGSSPVQTSFIPEVIGVEPDAKSAPDSDAEPVCTADEPRTVTVYGSNFYVVGDQTPQISFGMAGSWRADATSGCEVVEVDGRARRVRRCSVLEVTIPKGKLAPQNSVTQAYSVTVTNPNGADCISSDTSATFRTAAPPTIADDGLTENFACLEAGARSFTVTGDRFLRIQLGSGMNARTRVPRIEVGGKLFEPDSLSDCSPVSLDGGGMMGPANTIESCKKLSFTIPERRVAPTAGGSPHQVRIHQPAPTSCRGTASIPLNVDPAPTVTDVSALDATGASSFQPAPVCAEQTADQLMVTGQNIRLIEDANGQTTINDTTYRAPRVRIGGTTYEAPDVTVVDPTTNCTALTGRSRSVLECSTLAVATPAGKDGLGEGTHRVAITNPINSPDQSANQNYGCMSRTDHQVRFTAAPTLSKMTPGTACTGRPTNVVTAVGRDFLVVDPA